VAAAAETTVIQQAVAEHQEDQVAVQVHLMAAQLYLVDLELLVKATLVVPQ
jgi:hypothetical protein